MWTHLRQDTRFQQLVQSSSFFPVSMVLANQDNVFGPGYMPSPAIDGGSNPSIPQLPTQYDYFRQPNLVGYLPFLGQALPGVDDLALPGGYVYNQFRIFVSNNIPTKQVLLTYTASTTSDPTGAALRTAYPGYFFGRHVVGEIYGGDPMTEIPVQIQKNQNSDFNRYLIVIWQAFMGLSRLNDDFVIAARTYAP
jgi:hypothetical protein